MTNAQAQRGWKVCPTCPLDDNEWPPTEFYSGYKRCKACYVEERYPDGRGAKGREYMRKLRRRQQGAAA